MATESLFTDGSVYIKGPLFHFDFSGLYARHPVHYSDCLYIFQCTSVSQCEAQLAALRTGLQALLQLCPTVGGSVVPLLPDEAKNG
jgi:hypothetical protein